MPNIHLAVSLDWVVNLDGIWIDVELGKNLVSTPKVASLAF
jgi:hypothetical protein